MCFGCKTLLGNIAIVSIVVMHTLLRCFMLLFLSLLFFFYLREHETYGNMGSCTDVAYMRVYVTISVGLSNQSGGKKHVKWSFLYESDQYQIHTPCLVFWHPSSELCCIVLHQCRGTPCLCSSVHWNHCYKSHSVNTLWKICSKFEH